MALEYTIVTDANQTANDLEKKVSKKIADGWKPQGGVAIALENAGGKPFVIWAQAMVKGEK